MATYIPNATQTTEPVESRTVESAALEFRTLKTSINARIEDVQDGLDTEIVNRIAGDANLQTQNNAQGVRLTAIENALLSIGEGGLPGTVYVQRFSGTGVQTAFTLNAAPQSGNVVDIYINGIYQNKDTFSVAGAVITFSEAPPAGTDNIEVQVTVTIALGDTDASLVTYNATTVDAQLDSISAAGGSSLVGFQQAGAGAVVRTSQDKLRESVSVKDYGAVTGADIKSAVDAAVAYLSTVGGGVLDFAGISATCSSVTLAGVSSITLRGNGARLSKPVGSGTNSNIFTIKGGCSDIIIEGFADLDGGYDSSNTTTGSNPVILIGDQTGAGDGGATNQRIQIRNNRIRKANWAGVVVYGRSGTGGTPTPTNRDIKIVGNSIEDCGGNGIFFYKNSHDVVVANNVIDLVSTDGIIFDTMAASDTVTSEAISNVTITGNVVRRFGKNGQGIGILAKGAVVNLAVAENTVREGLLQPSGSFINYGILVNKDANSTRTAPKNVTISGNVVSDLTATLTAQGIQIGEGCTNVSVAGNSVRNCTGDGVYVNLAVKTISVVGNVVQSCGNGSYGYRLIGSSGNEITNLVMIGNVFEKGTSTATGGFNVQYARNGEARANLAPDFTTSAFNVTDSTNFTAYREFSGAAAPTSGSYVAGDIVVNTNTSTSNPVDRWRCLVGGTPGTWRASSWITGNAPTASRPTLTTSDIGVTYLDTTLDVDGKPIWWNGTAWVDATGAVV